MNTMQPTNAAQFDADFVSRYDVNGPRYTSYPAAPQFHADFGEAQMRAAARASNETAAPRPLSIYVHVPFCTSPCFYCGCTRVITRDRTKAEIYLSHLHREIAMISPLFDSSRRVGQLHFGGGTPNFLNAEQMQGLLETLESHFAFSRDSGREFGIELDPRFCDADFVRLLARYGINRISVGVQDFDADVQRAVNRIQSVEQTRDVIEAARGSGVRSVSIDLIYGLPKQTATKFAATLDQVVALRPDRIACYAYAHLPERFRAQRQIVAAELPDAATRLALLELTVRTLTDAGYRYIGMDHFALPDDDLVQAQDAGTLQRNFQGYSTHGDCDLIGLGVSAISHIGPTFSQNTRDLPAYYTALATNRLPIVRGLQLEADDLVRADVIQQLMCHGVLDLPAFAARHRRAFDDYFAAERERLHALEHDGLIRFEPDRLVVSPRGRFLLRNVAMCFDAHLARPQSADVRYSRAL